MRIFVTGATGYIGSAVVQELINNGHKVGAIAAFDMPRSSAETQEMLNWRPVHPTLISDLEQGHYFR